MTRPDGYARKVIEVNLNARTSEIRRFPDQTLRDYIGGSGLGSKILFEDLKADTNPFAPEAPLLFLLGPFNGTAIPGSSRYTVVAKSPLTNIFGEANAGGRFGSELKFAGFDGIIVRGKASTPVYLWISDGRIEIRDAAHLWGKDTFATHDLLLGETDSNASTVAIGQAGEECVKLACIITDGRDGRAAGRCGLGAVMGSKNLKAIAAKGKMQPQVANKVELTKSLRSISKMVVERNKGLSTYGTAEFIVGSEMLGNLPIRNWSQDRWAQASQISAEAMNRTILKDTYRCGHCLIGCGRVVEITSGPFEMQKAAGPEYETIGMLGAQCLVDNLEAVAKAGDLCNRHGLDHISTGGVIAFAMEAYERRLLTKSDTGGLALNWGDSRLLVHLVDLIGRREGIGDLLGNGVRFVAEQLGGEALEFAYHVKGLEIPAHDPRSRASLAVAYATSNRGACHVQASSTFVEGVMPVPLIGYSQMLDPFTSEGKGRMTALMQNLMCHFNALCLCQYMIIPETLDLLPRWLSWVTGWDISTEEFLKTGERIFNMKRLFNVRSGIARKDDSLPPRFLYDAKREGGAKGNLPDLELMLNDYYEARGWTPNGLPTLQRMKELGLGHEASEAINGL
jgi:aldehyde:ferredoxin oxidoreductase